MSRAFISKEQQEGDAVVEDLPERPVSPHPNYVTPSGLAKLEQQRAVLLQQRSQLLAAAQDDLGKAEMLRHVERDIRYLDARVDRAILVEPTNQPQGEVAFGAIVGVVDEDGSRHSFQIVGEDEADVAAGRVSYVSPLARALVGSRVGSIVTWERPAGDRVLRVTSIKYAGGGKAFTKAVAGKKAAAALRAPVKAAAKPKAKAAKAAPKKMAKPKKVPKAKPAKAKAKKKR
jgi:transcription elongation factor GreB